MGRINVISSIFEDSDVQHSMRDSKVAIARLDEHRRPSLLRGDTKYVFSVSILELSPLAAEYDVGPKPT